MGPWAVGPCEVPGGNNDLEAREEGPAEVFSVTGEDVCDWLLNDFVPNGVCVYV